MLRECLARCHRLLVLTYLAVGPRGYRHPPRRGTVRCDYLKTSHSDRLRGVDKDPLSVAIRMERDEGHLPGQQVLAAYRHSTIGLRFVLLSPTFCECAVLTQP